jgi:predicted RNA-binding protein with PUA-like domain
MAYWLMKSEPDAFSVDDLAKRPKQTEPWSGVRNYQARNFMRQMKLGDQAFFYHSSCDEVGVVGVMRVVAEAYPDPTQFDPKDAHYDPKSKREQPSWDLVEVKLERKLKRVIGLAELRGHDKKLQGLRLLMPGSRLSVIPVAPAHWDYILKLE